MAQRDAGPLVPIALLGLGLLFLGGGSGRQNAAPQPIPPGPVPPPVPPIGDAVRFQMYMGPPSHLYTVPVYIKPSELVLVTVDFCDGNQCTLVRVSKPDGSKELHLTGSPMDVLGALNITRDRWVKVSRPTGKTKPRTEEEWREAEQTMETVPIWIHRRYVKMIGPSSTVHFQRRRLGKIYTTDGLAIDLYESLSTLRKLVGKMVPETEEPYPRRED